MTVQGTFEMEFTEGFFYEQEVTGFLSLKALRETDDFCLISNASSCAPLDGIILCTKIHERNVIYLFQIFHKRNPKDITDEEFTSCKKSRFSIDAFHKNVLDSVEKIKEIIPETYKESCKFKYIFMTNRAMGEDCKIFDRITERDKFSTIPGRTYKFKSDFITREKTAAKREFLQNFYVYANQCDLRESSVDCIANMLNAEYETAESIKLEYFRCIENWFGILTDKYSLNKLFNRKLFMYAVSKQFGIALDEYAAYKNDQKVLKEESLNLIWETIKSDNHNLSSDYTEYVLGKTLEDLEELQGDYEVYIYLKRVLYSEELKAKKNQMKYYIECLLGRMPFIVANCNLSIPEDFLTHVKVVLIGSSGKEQKLPHFDKEHIDILKTVTITSNNGEIIKIGDIINQLPFNFSVSDLLKLIIDNYNRTDICTDMIIYNDGNNNRRCHLYFTNISKMSLHIDNKFSNILESLHNYYSVTEIIVDFPALVEQPLFRTYLHSIKESCIIIDFSEIYKNTEDFQGIKTWRLESGIEELVRTLYETNWFNTKNSPGVNNNNVILLVPAKKLIIFLNKETISPGSTTREDEKRLALYKRSDNDPKDPSFLKLIRNPCCC